MGTCATEGFCLGACCASCLVTAPISLLSLRQDRFWLGAPGTSVALSGVFGSYPKQALKRMFRKLDVGARAELIARLRV